MKSYKLFFSFLFLLTLSINFSFANICLGDTTTLNYTVSGVQPGQSCLAIRTPEGFDPLLTPTLNNGQTNSSVPVQVPYSGVVGNQGFSLTCGTGWTAGTDTDALNVLLFLKGAINEITCF
jgi:hypothetical protein